MLIELLPFCVEERGKVLERRAEEVVAPVVHLSREEAELGGSARCCSELGAEIPKLVNV